MSYEEVYAEVYGEALEEVLQADREKTKKRRARAKVKYALQHGQLVRPDNCEYGNCKLKDLQAHHPDYDYPLDVLWLCRYHHVELHKHFGNRVLAY